ncbi:alpha/beta hydrolase [Rhodohalobacter sulfatireducens]|uniref:Esterase family protein n=1 Tax=Rhodohalobacter sulfatireducens TaxID=2911366 RepID=A0ABS9KC46_9BACT|nr:alpha/beta hydrolase family protein [Rhodohalobacter sulfatireducens]MCG2588429.1 esterase family protein [Rhodohalobacter sulfatireducens]
MLYRIFSYLFLFILLPAVLPAQTSTIHESLAIESSVLNKNVNYNIYLPNGYEESNRSYPVLYLLHGYTDNEIGWTQFGEVQQIADEASESLSVTDMIIVMPDAGVSWYINNHDGSVNYEDFFTQELIPHVDETYRTRATKEFRAVAGLSMGGYGTLIMATKHSELFIAAAPLSAAVFLDEEISGMPQENWDNALGTPFGEALEGEDRLTDHYYKNSIIEIMENGDQEAIKSVDYYIDCGDDDFLIRGNLALYDMMVQNEISAEFRVRDGAHTWDYWRTALPDVLEFVSARFQR